MDFARRFLRDKLAVIGLAAVLLFFLISLAAPFIAPYQPAAIDVNNILSAPSLAHPFGTDQLGRDVLTRIMFGAGISLKVGFVAAGIATLIGVLLGAIAGYYGGWVDIIIMRLVDIMLCFPSFFLILAVIAFLEPSIYNIMIVIGATSWMGVTRLVRAEFLTLKERDFVLAERAMGASHPRIIFVHILPNALAPVLVSVTLGIASAVLIESSLSFLGIGVQPPMASWGSMLTEGKEVLGVAWWMSIYPGLAILLTVLGYNLLGEGIRDAIDPRLKG